ncbi:MAG: GntR family transcriptional regulator [Clostridia bacterium]|nr:GntR family transcriptional regulator [Clostridia bacterium]
MFELDLKSGVPICDQIVNGFIKMKALGLISAGDQMPSVRSLALKFSVNPNTVQKAYAVLESGGIIYSVKGRGSFVSDDEQAHRAVINKARNDFRAAVKAARELGLDISDITKTINDIYKEEKKC